MNCTSEFATVVIVACDYYFFDAETTIVITIIIPIISVVVNNWFCANSLVIDFITNCSHLRFSKVACDIVLT